MGGFQHITMDSDNHQQLWSDTVFMAVLFLAKIASVTGSQRYAEECKNSFCFIFIILRIKKLGYGVMAGLFGSGIILPALIGQGEIAGLPLLQRSCRNC